jgi:RNA polymerase sigma factor (sigma-70 family)
LPRRLPGQALSDFQQSKASPDPAGPFFISGTRQAPRWNKRAHFLLVGKWIPHPNALQRTRDNQSVDDAQRIVDLIPRLRRYARALAGDRARADDLVQDTLERAWNKFHLWRPGSDLRAWLFTVMHNVHVNQVRASRDHSVLDDEGAEMAVAPVQGAGLEMRDLERALALLPAEQREVLLLIALEDMSYAEVANTLGIPIGTVMSRLSRAREKLRGLMYGLPVAAKLQVIK